MMSKPSPNETSCRRFRSKCRTQLEPGADSVRRRAIDEFSTRPLLYALRVLRHDRAYSAGVVLTLAVCLRASTAIFTVVRWVWPGRPYYAEAVPCLHTTGSRAPGAMASAPRLRGWTGVA